MKLFFPVFYITVSLLCFGKVWFDYSRVESFDGLKSCVGKPIVKKEDAHILLIEVAQCELVLKKSIISADGVSIIKNINNVVTFKYGHCPDGCNYNFVYSVSSETHQYLTYDEVTSFLEKKRIWYLVIAVLLGVFGVYKVLPELNNKSRVV